MSKPDVVTLLNAAFTVLQPVLREIPNSPKTLPEFYDRLSKPETPDLAAIISKEMKAGKMLSVQETAKFIGVCPKTVDNMIKDGRIKKCLKVGKVVRIPKGSIAELLGYDIH
jgi:excisionase family DNA binding protein